MARNWWASSPRAGTRLTLHHKPRFAVLENRGLSYDSRESGNQGGPGKDLPAMIRDWYVHTPNGDRGAERSAPNTNRARSNNHGLERSARLERWLIGLLAVLMVVFSAIPIVIDLRG